MKNASEKIAIHCLYCVCYAKIKLRLNDVYEVTSKTIDCSATYERAINRCLKYCLALLWNRQGLSNLNKNTAQNNTV